MYVGARWETTTTPCMAFGFRNDGDVVQIDTLRFVVEWASEWVRRALRTTRHVIGYYRVKSFHTINYTGTDNQEKILKKRTTDTHNKLRSSAFAKKPHDAL